MSLLTLIPKPLHRALYRAAFRARARYVRLFRVELIGCSVVGLDEGGRILLVRHSYGHREWTVPGGGMRKGEDPLHTAVREMGEELSCGLKNPRFVTQLSEAYHGGTNQVHVVTGLVDGEPRPDMREILAARFFDPADLPDDIAPCVANRLALLGGGKD